MKKVIKTILLNTILVLMLSVSMIVPANSIKAATVNETDVNVPANGNSLVYVEGSFITENAQTILNRLNEIRLEACREGITIPGYKKLSTSDYVPLKWSADLEAYARIRSGELTLYWGHTRPNGTSCFKHNYGFNYSGLAENIAANGSGIMRGIEQFYGEKYDLLNNTGGETGHYTSIINPKYNYVGMGGFKADGGYFYYVGMQLASASKISENKNNFTGAVSQKLEIRNSSISSISLSGAESVDVGKSVKLALKGHSNNGISAIEFSFVDGATFSSSDTAIATVSSSGLVTGKKAGTVTITAKAAGKTASYKVTVKGNANTVAVSSISFNKSSLSLKVNSSETLTVTVNPSNASNKKVSYSSSDTSIATVDSNGKVTAKKAGIATITAKSDNGKTATCKVNVTNSTVAVSSLQLNKSSLSLKVNDSLSLTATVLPNNATNKSLTWSSSNTSVVTVDSKGKITAKKAGTATITVKSNNGKSATCKVTVTNKEVAVSSISLNYTSMSISVGKTTTLKATVNPSNATNKNISWSSSNSSVATVDSTGKVVAKKAGTTTITAKSNNGKIKTCKVTVTQPTINVTKVVMPVTSTSLQVNKTYQLKATVSPSNATNKTLSWSSNNSSVATVNSNGLVTAKKAGIATITVKSNNGKSATCKVYVTAPKVEVSSISLNYSSVNIKVNETRQLSATVYPSNATNKSLTWTSSNNNVATVDSNGLITAKKAGTATITVKSDNGKVRYCSVTVSSAGVQVTSISLQYPKLVISKGNSATVKATISPSNAADKSLIWTSSNTAVATVDSNGKVTAISAGTSELRATASNGKYAAITVYVNEPNKLTYGIKITKGTTRLQLGQSFKFEATLYPTSRDQVFNWKSSDTSVATIDSNGLVTTKNIGVTNISVSDGGQTYSYELVVYNGKVISPTSVSLNASNLVIANGATYQLKATVNPYNATVKNVSYSSSDSSIVKVNYQTGVITAVNKGSATITVTTKWGLHKVQCKVTVY